MAVVIFAWAFAALGIWSLVSLSTRIRTSGFREPGTWARLALTVSLGFFVGSLTAINIGVEIEPWMIVVPLVGTCLSVIGLLATSANPSGSSRSAPHTRSRDGITPKTTPNRPSPPTSRSSQRAAPKIFLSYRRADTSDVTGRIYDRLVQHYRREHIFKDVDSIPLGVDFRAHLTESVAQCQVLLVVVGKRWLTGGTSASGRYLDDPRDFVRIEIAAALERKIPIIPVLVQGATIPREDELPPSLRPLAYYNALEVRTDPDFHSDMGRLLKGMDAYLQATERKWWRRAGAPD